MLAIDKIKEQFITEQELADLLNVDPTRVRDLRSHHVQGKKEFIDHIKPSSKCVLYHYKDVIKWLRSSDLCSFGKNKECNENNDGDEYEKT